MYLMCECIVISSLYHSTTYSPRILSDLCPGSSPSLSTLSTLSPTFLLGISTMLFSAALRVWCYRTLGRLFTFEVTIKREHTLITSGPYAYVRHPSYTGVVLMLVGVATTCFASGSYTYECQIMLTPVRWLIRLWFVIATFATVSLWRRGRIEDDSLRQVFGETWNRYSQAVPCMFVPGLF
jgi:protein-S-isoprenylcysteine O-methyltransferase Ste14